MCTEQSFMFKPKNRFVGQVTMPSHQFVVDNTVSEQGLFMLKQNI